MVCGFVWRTRRVARVGADKRALDAEKNERKKEEKNNNKYNALFFTLNESSVVIRTHGDRVSPPHALLVRGDATAGRLLDIRIRRLWAHVDNALLLASAKPNAQRNGMGVLMRCVAGTRGKVKHRKSSQRTLRAQPGA